MAKKKKYAIGVDLGGTKILVILVDEKFRILAEIKAKTKPQKGENYFFATLKNCIESVMHDVHANRKEIAGLGLGCPGIIDEKRGVVIASPNISFLKNQPLGPKLQSTFGLNVALGNDVKTGLWGEYHLGAAKGFRHVIGIFIGTGIGGAFIFDGKLYLGASGGAGEIGHIQVDPDGPLCGCGRRGCFEAMCSRLAIATEAAAIAARQKAPHLLQESGTDILNIKSGSLAKAIRFGDRAIEELVRTKARLIGNTMGSLVNLLNPDAIILGGGLVEAMPKLIVQEATHAMRSHAMAPLAKHVHVLPAKLRDYSVALGAAKKAWEMTTCHG